MINYLKNKIDNHYTRGEMVAFLIIMTAFIAFIGSAHVAFLNRPAPLLGETFRCGIWGIGSILLFPTFWYILGRVLGGRAQWQECFKVSAWWISWLVCVALCIAFPGIFMLSLFGENIGGFSYLSIFSALYVLSAVAFLLLSALCISHVHRVGFWAVLVLQIPMYVLYSVVAATAWEIIGLRPLF